jgi:hypothetical protein
MGMLGRAASGVVSSATMVTGPPQCGQSRWAAVSGTGAAGPGVGAAGADAELLEAWLPEVSWVAARWPAAARLQSGEQ